MKHSSIKDINTLTSNRPYRKKASTAEAITYLQEQSRKLFDPQIVKTFQALVLQGQASELLTSG